MQDLSTAPGVDALASTLSRMVVKPNEVATNQSAVAEFTTDGFEAAAVTTVGARASALPPNIGDHAHREAVLQFNRPYAVIALAVQEGSPWDRVPVFSAWVDHPTEPEPLG